MSFLDSFLDSEDPLPDDEEEEEGTESIPPEASPSSAAAAAVASSPLADLDGSPSPNLLLESEPLHLVQYRLANDSFFVDEEACEMLCQLEGPLHVICMTGRTRIGKSYLLNRFFGPSADLFAPRKDGCRGFVTSGLTDSCTTGIWVWARVVNSKTVLLLDTEGLDAVNRNPLFEHKLLSLALLLSSTFIFSSLNVIDRNSISLLDFVNQLSRIIVFRDSEEPTSGQGEETFNASCLPQVLPRFIWVVRDFFLDLKGRTPTEYMHEQFAMTRSRSPQIREANQEIDFVSANFQSFFRERECVVLTRPCENESFLSSIESRPDLVTPKFRRVVTDFIQSTIAKSRPRMYGSVEFDGFVFANLARRLVDALNSQKQLNIDVSFGSLQERSNMRLIEEVVQKYSLLMRQEIEKEGLPMNTPDLLACHRRIYGQLHRDAFLKRLIVTETDRSPENLVKIDFGFTLIESSGEPTEPECECSHFVDTWSAILHQRIEGWKNLPENADARLRRTVEPLLRKVLDENAQETRSVCRKWLQERWQSIERALGAKDSPYRTSETRDVTACLENYDRDRKEVLEEYKAATIVGDALTKANALEEFCREKSREINDLMGMNVAAADVVARLLREKRRIEQADQARRITQAQCDSVLEELIHQRQLFESRIGSMKALEESHMQQFAIQLELDLATQRRLVEESRKKRLNAVNGVCSERVQALEGELRKKRREASARRREAQQKITDLRAQLRQLEDRRN